MKSLTQDCILTPPLKNPILYGLNCLRITWKFKTQMDSWPYICRVSDSAAWGQGLGICISNQDSCCWSRDDTVRSTIET